MAMALAPETYYPLAAVYEEAGRNLDLAKSADKDCIYLLGRMLEWRHLADAAELKDTVTRLMLTISACRGSSCASCAVSTARRPYGGRHARRRRSAPWRFQRRFNRILSGTRDREFQKLRTHLINEMVGRKGPAGE